MLNQTKTIYKKDSKNKIRFLKYTATDKGTFIYTSGIIDTPSSFITKSKECKPKNIGKKNETTAYAQAFKELQSKVKAKLRGEYFESIDKAMTTKVYGVMLAESWDKKKDQVVYPCYVQPKFDGQRCFSFKTNFDIKLVSRDHVPITNLPNIERALIKNSLLPGNIYDGELYIHGKTFQEIIKILKNGNVHNELEYHIYDVVGNESYMHRYALLAQLTSVFNNTTNSTIKITPTFLVNNEKEVDTYYQKFISEGYEGLMVRWGNEGYELNKRTKYLLKYKRFFNLDATIIDVLPNEVDPTQGTPQLEYTHIFNGKKITVSFKAGCKLSHKERQNLLINKKDSIGKTANIRYFEFTDEGLPRFPVFLGIHNDR